MRNPAGAGKGAMLPASRIVFVALMTAACGRGPVTSECPEEGRKVLSWSSVASGDVLSMDGGWVPASMTQGLRDRVAAVIRSGDGALTSTVPVTPRTDQLTVGFWMSHESYAGTLSVAVSTDAGLEFRTVTTLPSLDVYRSGWTYYETTVRVGGEPQPTLVQIRASGLSPLRVDIDHPLTIDELTIIDPAACLRPACQDGVPSLLHERDQFRDEQVSLTGSWRLDCGDGSRTVCVRDAGGAVRISPDVPLERAVTRVRLRVSHPAFVSGALSVAVSYDGGVSFPVVTPVDVDLKITALNPFWVEVDVATERADSAAFEVRAELEAPPAPSYDLHLHEMQVEQLGDCR